MTLGPKMLLVGAVAAVGVLHTIVPDHWAPIAFIARQRSWSKAETARASFLAGVGHVLSTLLIAAVVWLAGVAVAAHFAHFVDLAASVALVAFGSWIAISAWRELQQQASHGHGHSHGHTRSHGHALDGLGEEQLHDSDRSSDHVHHANAAHSHDMEWVDDPLYASLRDTAVLVRHAHVHRHGRGAAHVHKHDHLPQSVHSVPADIAAAPPLHKHLHKTSARTALLLVLGSSPMVEGIPAFFAASNYGIGLIIVMSIVFAITTIATYVLLCVYSSVGLQRIHLGTFERYGEVLSGIFIAIVGVVFWVWPVS